MLKQRWIAVAFLFFFMTLTSHTWANVPVLGDKKLEFENAKKIKEIGSQHDEVRILTKPIPIRGYRYTSSSSFNMDPFSTLLQGEWKGLVYEVPKTYSKFQVYSTLIGKLKTSGYTTLFECKPNSCGESVGNHGATEHAFYARTTAEELSYTIHSKEFYLATARKISGPSRQWVSLMVNGDTSRVRYHVIFIDEKAAPKNEAQLENVETISESIDRDGKAALYGIYFDTDKAILKQESDSTIEQIAKFLSARPQTRLIVTGHTDNQGEFLYNVKLSEARSKAVIQRISERFKVSASRLTPFGAGMAAPIASNEQAGGRALNRRVELVLWK